MDPPAATSRYGYSIGLRSCEMAGTCPTVRTCNIRHPHLNLSCSRHYRCELACRQRRCMCHASQRLTAFIRIDAIRLATDPMDMRASTETALARVIAVFGAEKPHCTYLFVNRRATRIKILVHDGFSIWLAARRLTQGKFHWPSSRHGAQMEFTPSSFRRG